MIKLFFVLLFVILIYYLYIRSSKKDDVLNMYYAYNLIDIFITNDVNIYNNIGNMIRLQILEMKEDDEIIKVSILDDNRNIINTFDIGDINWTILKLNELIEVTYIDFAGEEERSIFYFFHYEVIRYGNQHIPCILYFLDDSIELHSIDAFNCVFFFHCGLFITDEKYYDVSDLKPGEMQEEDAYFQSYFNKNNIDIKCKTNMQNAITRFRDVYFYYYRLNRKE